MKSDRWDEQTEPTGKQVYCCYYWQALRHSRYLWINERSSTFALLSRYSLYSLPTLYSLHSLSTPSLLPLYSLPTPSSTFLLSTFSILPLHTLYSLPTLSTPSLLPPFSLSLYYLSNEYRIVVESDSWEMDAVTMTSRPAEPVRYNAHLIHPGVHLLAHQTAAANECKFIFSCKREVRFERLWEL